MTHLESVERRTSALHLLAWATLLLTLTPITVGAVVTTIDAGMAFRDWPTSNGIGMFSYPLHKANRDQFWEHSHRLLGSFIGMLSIALVVMAYVTPTTRSVRWLSVEVLVGVIAQGVLGGIRVRYDDRALAMVHGIFAAVVLTMMGCLVLMTSRNWSFQRQELTDRSYSRLMVSTMVTLLLILVQYAVGSVLRHLAASWAWIVHPWFAAVVFLAAAIVCSFARNSQHRSLARWGTFLLSVITAQILLGLLTWRYRYGFPEFGLVGMRETSFETASRTLHMVFGTLTLVSCGAMLLVIRHARPTTAAEKSASLNLAGHLPLTGVSS